MEALMDEVCGYINNYFSRRVDIHAGHFKIESGSLIADFLQENQYFRITGSVLNDGVYQYPAVDLSDEEFDGYVWAMKVPPAFIALLTDIAAWRAKYEDINSPAMSPFSSETFSNYTYVKSVGGNRDDEGSSNGQVNWISVFGSRLSRWRKL